MSTTVRRRPDLTHHHPVVHRGDHGTWSWRCRCVVEHVSPAAAEPKRRTRSPRLSLLTSRSSLPFGQLCGGRTGTAGASAGQRA
jgi:hypothetical protein